MVLKRYDGEFFKTNLADISTSDYFWWILDHSTKPVDELTPAIFQMAKGNLLGVVIVFVDFKNPELAAKSTALIELIEEIKPQFEKLLKFAWTDKAHFLDKRETLGITWSELPALGMSSMQRFDYAYRRQKPFEKQELIQWLEEIANNRDP